MLESYSPEDAWGSLGHQLSHLVGTRLVRECLLSQKEKIMYLMTYEVVL